MRQRVLASLFSAIAVLVAAPVGAEPPPVLECRGHEPEWSLRIDGANATLATLEAHGLAQSGLEGRLDATGQPTSFVYRGRARGSAADLVAVVTREACVDSMADAHEADGPRGYTARVSLPDGALRQGCCAVVPASTSPAEAAAAVAPAASPATIIATPGVPAPTPARAAGTVPGPVASAVPTAPSALASSRPAAVAATPGGEITGLTLSDGHQCASTGRDATLSSRGRRLSFDCGPWGGDRLGLVGPLTVDATGVIVVQRVVIEWREGQIPPRDLEPAAARVTQIVLADGLTCRSTERGATLAFDGRRASFTCGMKDGDTVALLGEPEPVEGGFRIVRARVAHGEGGFTLRSSEPILVTAPR